MKRIPPLAPITLELRKRLGEIIAERPPQEIASEASGRLGEIIEERIAGLPPEQRIEVAQLTILEILLTTPSALATPPGRGAVDRPATASRSPGACTAVDEERVGKDRAATRANAYRDSIFPRQVGEKKQILAESAESGESSCRRGSRGPSPKRRASERGGASEPSSKRDSATRARRRRRLCREVTRGTVELS